MKHSALLFLASSVLITGCGDKSKPSASGTNAAGGNPITAPVDYLDAVSKAQNRAIASIDVSQLKEAIQSFNIQEGRFPKDLNELLEAKLIGKIPDAPYGSKLDYDANTGIVRVIKK